MKREREERNNSNKKKEKYYVCCQLKMKGEQNGEEFHY